jgi:hypothetical protein
LGCGPGVFFSQFPIKLYGRCQVIIICRRHNACVSWVRGLGFGLSGTLLMLPSTTYTGIQKPEFQEIGRNPDAGNGGTLVTAPPDRKTE